MLKQKAIYLRPQQFQVQFNIIHERIRFKHMLLWKYKKMCMSWTTYTTYGDRPFSISRSFSVSVSVCLSLIAYTHHVNTTHTHNVSLPHIRTEKRRNRNKHRRNERKDRVKCRSSNGERARAREKEKGSASAKPQLYIYRFVPALFSQWIKCSPIETGVCVCVCARNRGDYLCNKLLINQFMKTKFWLVCLQQLNSHSTRIYFSTHTLYEYIIIIIIFLYSCYTIHTIIHTMHAYYTTHTHTHSERENFSLNTYLYTRFYVQVARN